MSFHKEVLVKKTRKQYVCDGCLDKIPIGFEAKRGAGVFQGDFYNYIICIPCDNYLQSSCDFLENGWREGDIGIARRGGKEL